MAEVLFTFTAGQVLHTNIRGKMLGVTRIITDMRWRRGS